MRKIFLCITVFIATTATARTLHYGAHSVELTDTQKTFPALHIQISESETVYGAMYKKFAATDTLRIAYSGTEYWIGQWCEPGYYIPAFQKECSPCGAGFYCAGGQHSVGCCGKTDDCTGKNHSTEPSPNKCCPIGYYIPTGETKCVAIPENIYNKFLSMNEVNTYIIPTDIYQWDLIASCGTKNSGCSATDTVTKQDCACAYGTLQPGLYLFTETYAADRIHDLIILLDHPTGYRIVHGTGVFRIILDLNHETFQSETTLSRPAWSQNHRAANVRNFPVINYLMSIYKLN